MAGVRWSNVSYLTPGMKNLGNQFNRRWPDRSGTSDGAIGDAAHATSSSDHNRDDSPYDNASWDSDSDSKSEVRAIDVDKDLGSDVSMAEVINHMRRLPNLGSVIRYMIYDGKMYHVRDGFAATTYTGSNKHREHAHFTGAWSQSSDENTSFDFKFEQLGAQEMPVLDGTDVGKIWAAGFGTGENRVTAGTLLVEARQNTQTLLNAVAAIAAKVDLDPAEINAIKNSIVIPTPQQNAQAVVDALGDVGVDTLADILKEGLSPEERAELAAALLA